jgi:Na+/H+ antiporter NhaD/arsenite permease-like protein
MLLSIALCPLATPNFWHHHFGKVSAFWAASMSLPFLLAHKEVALHELLHILLADFVPFIILLWSLYAVSGGILLRGTLRGTPVVNSLMLVLGTAMASWMGTTGASMLLIRPFREPTATAKTAFMVVFISWWPPRPDSRRPAALPGLSQGPFSGLSGSYHMLLVTVLLLTAYFIMDS